MSALTAKNVTIGSRSPIRKDVATLTTYHADHFDAFLAIDTILAKHNLTLGWDMRFDLSTASGTVILPLESLNGRDGCIASGIKIENPVYSNGISYSWHTMQSGKLEIVAYVSL